MAIGSSNRIVVEVETDLKAQIYAALKSRGMTFKEWLIDQATSDLLVHNENKQNQKSKSRAE